MTVQMQTLIKGLIMTAIIGVATTFQTVGWPTTATQGYILFLTTFGTLVTYFAQSFVLVTSSTDGTLDWKDFLKGLLVAIGNLLATVGTSFVVNNAINWSELWKSMIAIFLAYIVKQYATPVTIKATQTVSTTTQTISVAQPVVIPAPIVVAPLPIPANTAAIDQNFSDNVVIK